MEEASKAIAEQHRAESLALCDKLLYAMERNRDEADWFCNGEIHRTYVSVNESVADRIRKIRRKLGQL